MEIYFRQDIKKRRHIVCKSTRVTKVTKSEDGGQRAFRANGGSINAD